MINDARIGAILDVLQDIAAGNLHRRLKISAAHDELDAFAHAINVVAGELDYTARRLSRAREEAELASAAKTTFLRDVSHELRTPLSAILGAAQLLQMRGVGEARRGELEAGIVANVHAQAELLNDLLDLSQVESGKLAIEMRPTSVDALLDEVVASLEPAAEGKGLSLVLEAGVPADLHVLGDRRRLRQIMVNVVGNAVKFTARGRIVVRADREGMDVVIDIADTGLGIDPAQVDRLFEPFTQAEPSIGPRFGGSGLGLALARRLAREMDGDLALLATAPGDGATFRLRLPECPFAGPRHDLEQAASPLAPSSSLDGVRLLLVDDYEDIRMPLATLLRLKGATVDEAGSGEEAIELGRRPGIDVILMDIRMPDVDGLEASRRLRALGVLTPIVAVTADVVAHRTDYAEAGCNLQLAKPIDGDHLVGVILALLEPTGRGAPPPAG